MEIEKSGGSGGAWLKKADLKNGDLIKLKTEAKWEEGQNGKQLVAKCRVKGQAEDVNIAVNTPTRNGLIDAFGSDSVNWIDKPLTVAVEAGRFAGKKGIMLNLIPEGYELSEDAGGYLTITKAGDKIVPPKSIARTRSKEEVEEDIDLDADTPF